MRTALCHSLSHNSACRLTSTIGYYSLIRTTIEEQLSDEPDVTTRNRKPLKRPVFFEATWELRFGPRNQFRVFYDIDQTQHVVSVLAIGVKRGNRLFIGGEEIRL